MATFFSICALSTPWRSRLGEDQNIVLYEQKRKWIVALNAMSLIAALIANAALFLNMSKRLSFAIAQTTTTIGFFIAACLLAAATAEFGAARHPSLTSGIFTSAFWYAVIAAAAYLIITILMCATLLGGIRCRYRQLGLDPTERILMLQTMAFFAYILLGALMYKHLEGWTYLDAVYWADVTLLTVGFGDTAPSTDAGRGILIPFALAGIINIGLVVNSIRKFILAEGREASVVRKMEKNRLRALESWHLADEAGRTRIRVSRFRTLKIDRELRCPSLRRKLEFKVMRDVQRCTEQDQKWGALFFSALVVSCLWLSGAAVFMATEHWSYFDAVYFTYVCLMTIGYGDLAPKSNPGRAFFVMWSILAVPALTILVSHMTDTVIQFFSDIVLWLGSTTISPGHRNILRTARVALQNALKCQWRGEDGFEIASHDSCPVNATVGHSTDRDEPDSLEKFQERMRTHPSSTNNDDYRSIMAQQIKSLAKDLKTHPPRRYQWSEWEGYLWLMHMGRVGNLPSEDEPQGDRHGQIHLDAWDWLSPQSPLLSRNSETEWILEKLCACLEESSQRN